jgi:hypothetical protein
MILTKKAINFLNEELKLPSNGAEQDWSIELSGPMRLNEFISYYINNSFSLTDETKIALMALILSSFDDLLNEGIKGNEYWKRIEFILTDNKPLFNDILSYWGLNGETEDLFLITPFIRKLNSGRV